MFDLVEKNGELYIKTFGGGGIVLNDEKILDEKSFRDAMYPVGMQFVFPSGYNPTSQVGGNWKIIAQDIILPLGNSAPVTLSKAGGFVLESKDASKNLYVTAGNGTLTYWTGSTFGSGENLYYCAGISATANLASAATTKLISIWERLED